MSSVFFTFIKIFLIYFDLFGFVHRRRSGITHSTVDTAADENVGAMLWVLRVGG